MPLFAFTGSLTRPAPNYRAANGKGISSLVLEAATGHLQPVATLAGIDDAGWLTVDRQRRRLYAACEVAGTDQSWIAAFAIGTDGRLTLLNRQPTSGQTACHASLSPDGRFLLVANYNAVVPKGFPDDAVAIFPVTAGGLGPALDRAHHRGNGPNAARQERAHAHCVVPSPDGRFAYVTDLGLDRIIVYALSPNGDLTPHLAAEVSLPPGTGPRHLVFDQSGERLFLVSELIPTVVSFAVEPATGTLQRRDTFVIPNLGEAVVQPAGIVATADGRHLFVGLRECNEILGLAVDPISGALRQTGRWPCGGATPRDFALSPDGALLLVANQDSDSLTVFPVTDGELGPPVQNLALGTPMAIALAEL